MVVIGNFRNRAELRQKPRRAFNYGARILMSETGPLRSCHLLDVSHTGARIVLEHDGEIPDRFVLLLTKSGGPRRYCRVVWRDGTMVGVTFLNGVPEL